MASGALMLASDMTIRKLGVEWKRRPSEGSAPSKMFDRKRGLRTKHRLIDVYLPEYAARAGKSVLDVSCGTGAFLEIMRHHGHAVMGTDVQYFEFLESQGIPYLAHDGNRLPYPFADASYDLVSCIGAMSCYRSVGWQEVLGEFFRIARDCVFVVANRGEVLEKNRHVLERWSQPGWRATTAGGSIYKWQRVR